MSEEEFDSLVGQAQSCAFMLGMAVLVVVVGVLALGFVLAP